MGMRSKNPRPLMSQLSMHLMILFHKLQKPRKCTLSSSPSVKSSLSSTAKSNSYCFLCKRPGPKLVNVPPKARFFLHFFTMKLLFLLEAVVVRFIFMKICLQMKRCTNDTNENITLNRTSILNLLKNLRIAALHNETSGINFDDELYSSNFIDF